MATPWRLQLMGTALLRPATGLEAAVPIARKDAAWLALAAIQQGQSSLRNATLVWPGTSGAGALNNLRQRLHRLRKTTGARLVEMGETMRLAADLELEPADIDQRLAADPSADIACLLAGHEFDGEAEFAAWLAAQRQLREQALREALGRLATAHEAEGSIVLALRCAQRLIAEAPLSEHAHRRVMRLHYLRGDRAAAVAAFEACERTLKDELGLRPDAETVALLATIERSGTAALAARPVLLPASLLRPPRTVGRDAALCRLLDAAGGHRLALVVGEAGIGKTRVLRDLVACRDSASIVYAQARPGDAGVPYGAMRRLLAALDSAASAQALPAVEATIAIDLPAARHRLANAAGRGLATLVVDDLHFADRASIEGLRALVDDDALAGLSWVFAHRPADAAEEDGALLRGLAHAEGACWIALPPLAEPELAELVASLGLPGADDAALTSALWRHTGGNPLYALETLRSAFASADRRVDGALGALLLPRPQSIAHMIDRRLQRLSERALALGRVAALAGPDFNPALAEQALATPALLLAGAWSELEAADVLRGNAFAHDLVRDAMLRATPQPIAAHAHGLIAQYLEGLAAEPARVAVHWAAAGAHAQAAVAFRDAAARAQRLTRPREQAQLLLQAAEAFDRAADRDSAITARADAIDPLLQAEGSSAALAVSSALVQSEGDGAHAAQVWLQHANALLWAGKAADAESAARRALELARADETRLRLDSSLLAAQACGLQGRADEGLALLRPWEEHIENIDTASQRLDFCSAYENLMIQADRPTESLPWSKKHLAFAEADGNVVEQVTAHMNLAAYRLREGQLDAGIEHARAAEGLCPADAQAQGLARWNRNGLGYMLCGVGRFDEGLDILEAELQASQGTTGALRALQVQWLADVMIMLGQLTRAHQLIDGDDSIPPGMRQHKRLLVRAKLARASGQDDVPLLEQAREAAQRPSTQFDRLSADIELAARYEGPPEAFVDLATQSRQRGYWPLVMRAQQWRLRTLLREASWTDAVEATPELEALARRCRYPTFHFPELLHTCAQVWATVGRSEDARRCLTEATYWLQSVALPQVPERYREGFLQRNPANLALQAEFTRLMATLP